MAKTRMNVVLIAHSQLDCQFLMDNIDHLIDIEEPIFDGNCIALTAIRTCYSHIKPSKIIKTEGAKYLFKKDTDKSSGTEADRLIQQVTKSGHTSTLEHISFTFAVEDVSRALLAQLTRHRIGFSFSVQSQRYVRQSSDSRHGGFDYIEPKTIDSNDLAKLIYERFMTEAQAAYDALIKQGIPAEDARMVFPGAATTNITLTLNLRALLDLYGKRRSSKGAQNEICQLADKLREAVIEVEPWTEALFGGVGAVE